MKLIPDNPTYLSIESQMYYSVFWLVWMALHWTVSLLHQSIHCSVSCTYNCDWKTTMFVKKTHIPWQIGGNMPPQTSFDLGRQCPMSKVWVLKTTRSEKNYMHCSELVAMCPFGLLAIGAKIQVGCWSKRANQCGWTHAWCWSWTIDLGVGGARNSPYAGTRALRCLKGVAVN